jgi:PhzF family phenazine biosynthesis protein
MLRRFMQIDVFPAGKLAGNPLAVVVDGEGLSVEEMHTFARWTGLSETTFVLAPDDDRADYRIRIFTPRGEIPFAGHPTLGSCHAWLQTSGRRDRDHIVQQCGAGLVQVQETDHGLAFVAPPRRRSGPLGGVLTRHIADLLQIAPTDILAGEWADNGADWAAVLLEDAEAVLALEPVLVDLEVGVIGPYGPDGPAQFEVRAFYSKNGAIAEDPVTGSLNAALAEWLLSEARAQAPYEVRQGTAIGHDGRVFISQDDTEQVWVAGATETIIEGTVLL